jgi:hypothetical protein
MALVAFGIAACSDSTAPRSFVGAFALVAVNGTAPPVIIAQDATGTLEVTGGRITLNSDMTFRDSTEFRVTDSNNVSTIESDVVTGTYTTSGSTATLTPTGDAPYDLTLSGNTLTQTAGNLTITYNR